MPTLIVLQGPDKGRVLDVPEEPALLGRDPDCLALSDTTISRHHARISAGNGAFIIEDLGSANGTLVNGTRIGKPYELHRGDQIRLGATLMVFGGHPDRLQLPPPRPRDLVDLDASERIDSAVLRSVSASDESVVIAAPETAAAVKNLRLLYQLSSALSAIHSIPALLEYVMEMIFEKTGAERGFILMHSEKSGQFEPAVVRHRDPTVAPEKIQASRTIVQYVLDRREGVLCTNALGDTRFSSGQSVQRLGIRSVICVPIVARDRILGVIHVDMSMADRSFDEDQLRLLTAIGFATGLGVENARLVQAAVRAERLTATGEAVASLSHYIKNILQGMRGGADVIELGLKGERLTQVEKGWGIVRRNLRRIYDLAVNMLAFSKERQPNYRPVDLNRLINEVLEMVSHRCDEKAVLTVTDLQPDMPPITIDEDGIHQAVLNIVNNAIDAVQAGSGAVSVRSSFDPEAAKARIAVVDNGPGFDEEAKDELFEAFKSTKGHGGTGLGLAVARKIVEEHRGRITVETAPGTGTTFEITLPAGPPPAAGRAAVESAKTMHGPAA